MNKKSIKNQEEGIRKKIREELEASHRASKSAAAGSEETSTVEQDVTLQINLIKRYLRKKLEEDMCSQHPEFIKCENYLGEIRWLTPLELEKNHEYYPQSVGFFKKWLNRLKPAGKDEILLDPVYQEYVETYKQEIQQNIEERLSALHDRIEHERKKYTVSHSRLYREEKDRFYASKPGYRKYRNHIGEEKWMTPEEYENQDEFYEEVIPLKKRILQWSLLFVSVVVLAGVGYFVYRQLSPAQKPESYLIIEVPRANGNLYIDRKLAVGFNPGRIWRIEPGRHELAFLGPELISNPHSLMIEINPNDTLKISLNLVKRTAVEDALVIIKAPYPDAALFINGDFNGPLADRDSLVLAAGKYELLLEKEGYSCIPEHHEIELSKGDTVRVSFEMRPTVKASARQGDYASGLGLVQVTSTVKNADIYLDGKKTGYKTDYVLQNVPLGNHSVSLNKEGYVITPDQQKIVLSKDRKQAQAHFILKSTSREITVRTEPVEATILIDGEKVGFGKFRGRVSVGEHRISFGDVSYYDNPGAQPLIVTNEGDGNFVFNLKRNFKITFSPRGIEPAHIDANLEQGYILSGNIFKRGDDAGPEVRSVDPLGPVWWMGYAFEYRNPRGIDALQINFNIPSNIDLSRPVYLRVYAYQTDSDYPLALGGESSYKVVVNNTVIKKNMIPSATIQQAEENKFDQFIINNVLQKGYNRIIIATMDDASAFMALWKIIIR